MKRAPLPEFLQSILNVVIRHNNMALRIAFAIVYVWFGILKPLGLSPATGLVQHTLSMFPHDVIAPALGIWEVIIGVMFLIPKYTRITMAMFAVHMAGTFLPMFFQPELAYTQAPFVFTLVGQYIVKNLVFVAAAGYLWAAYEANTPKD